MQHDYSGEEEVVSSDQLAQLSQLADKLESVEKQIEAKEAELKQLSEDYRQLREKDIPELMLAVGMKSIKTTAGVSIELKEEVRAQLPKDAAKREETFSWLDANGHSGLVKNTYTFKFGRDQQELVEKFDALIEQAEFPLNKEQKLDINHQTMLAFLREQLRNGEEVPMHLFGAFVQQFAKIKK